MSSYSFSTNSQFTSDPNNLTLINNDIAASNISVNHLDTSSIGDVLSITFNEPLSTSDIIILSNIISSRDIPTVIGDKIFSVYPTTNIKSTTYQLLFKIPFKNWNITNIEINSYMDPGLTNYTMRLYNPVNGTTIFQSTQSNTSESISNFTSFSNIPSDNTQLEFHVKVSGGLGLLYYAHINSVIIYFN